MRHGEVVVAVVPLFNPPDHLQDVVARLVRQCAHVVLVDDGSAEHVWARIVTLTSGRVSVIRPGGNQGIAAALNSGVRQARSWGHVDFILTCDQDSLISEIYVAAALNRLHQVDHSEEYGLVAASSINKRPVQKRLFSRLEPLEPMQSGMLIRALTFDRVGYFREDLFIDCVDTDFYLRCRSAGLKTLSAPPCPFVHHLGSSRWDNAIGNRFSRHPPWRTFYMIRNRLKTMQLHGGSDWEWAVRIVAIQAPAFIATVVSSPDRRAQWFAMRRGYRDFRSGSSGPIGPEERRPLPRTDGGRPRRLKWKPNA
ncbi:glycosyltransferase [Terrabacter sp. BE26]|uniref:glycosyltransferase n=1 Tax=Terrabacter sp. BE26 TaxID=2898152 RepID=UPI0035BE1061